MLRLLLCALPAALPAAGSFVQSTDAASSSEFVAEPDTELEAALVRAGENRAELEAALAGVPEDQRSAQAWLIARMPERDLRSLDADFLITNCTHAFAAWRAAPWKDAVSEDLFRDAVLPYASVSERRDDWRASFRERFAPLVADARSPGEAAVRLNQTIFTDVGVRYSTKRKRADQGPLESMEIGLASCTGLSVLLIDACRAVGVPARLVGTPLWSDKSGNHSWVEVWDGRWRFTGAAEPSGDELDKGWFTGRASGAIEGDPRHAIFATTWRRTPLTFPMVWARGESYVNAVDVTARYVKERRELPEGRARVRVRVWDGAERERFAARVRVLDAGGALVFEGRSKDERFDANDHLTVELDLGAEYTLEARLDGRGVSTPFEVTRDEQLVTLDLGAARGGDGGTNGAGDDALLDALAAHLGEHGLEGLADLPLAGVALSREQADAARALLLRAYAAEQRELRAAEHEARVLADGEHSMPFWFAVRGEAPERGRSLYISMHGGGGAPTRVNDRQWENQKRLYEPAEGVYVAPRAPTDTWNLWHQAHVDRLFDRLITNMVLLEGVDPDRVYLMGYSAGGDGVYQLAPRMADRLAAAAMMAGHPNETRPDGLRNLPFTLHMGGEDGAYDRNEVARRWKEDLAALHAEDPGGYDHWVEIHEGKGHWMDREDGAALPWMASRTRDLRPERVVWLQDDVTHARFYWLAVDEPRARARTVVERAGQEVTVLEGSGTLRVRLDDEMLDLDAPVVVRAGERELHRGRVDRTVGTLLRTLLERGDPRGLFSAEVVVDLD